jgi:hypothetical protein
MEKIRDKKESKFIRSEYYNHHHHGEEATLWSAEEEEEERERRARFGNGAVEAWTEQVVDRVGVASQGCVCLACDFEIE